MEVFGIVQALPGSAGCKKIADFAVVLVGSTAVAKAVVDSWYTRFIIRSMFFPNDTTGTNQSSNMAITFASEPRRVHNRV